MYDPKVQSYRDKAVKGTIMLFVFFSYVLTEFAGSKNKWLETLLWDQQWKSFLRDFFFNPK